MPTCLSPLRSGRECLLLTPRIPSGFARGKISVYKKIYFRIYEKIFSHMRKFFFVRTEISFLPHGAKFPFGRRPNFLPQENLFPCGRKNIFLRKKIFFRAHGNFSLSAEPFFSLGEKGKFGRGKRLLREGRRGGFLGEIWKIACGRNIFAVRLPMEGGRLRLT